MRVELELNEIGCFEFLKRFKNFVYFNVLDLDLLERCVLILCRMVDIYGYSVNYYLIKI